MKRLLLGLAIASLVVAPAALAKGPTSATIEGPGTDALTFARYDSPGVNLTHITQQAGFFDAVFGSPAGNRMLPGRPKGALGPRYTITYEVGPGPVVVQDLYPYAKPEAVTYTRPGQRIFDRESPGGWFRSPALKETLVAAGLPASAPGGSSDGTAFPARTLGLLAFTILVAGTTVLVVRRRARPAAA